MNIFRKLRWKLTLNYTIVTVSAFLVVILILGGIVLPRIFVPINIVTPEVLLGVLQKNSNPLWSRVLSQSPVDTELIKQLMQQDNPQITSFDFLRIGSVQFTVRTMADWRGYIIGADGTLLGMTKYSYSRSFIIGQPFDPKQIEGLEAPYNAALAGVTDYSRLYTIYEPEKRFVLAFPIIDNLGEENTRVVGVIVLQMDVLPTQADVPAHILDIASRSLLFFLLGIGIMGAIFGAFFARGLTTRFNRLFTTIDAWSMGDFSKFMDDTTGDEISQFSQRLNNMAKQLQDLLRRRQDMAVSEERNRLARDLHDSAKQQALAASFQLGTALTLYDRDPQIAKKHLVEADALVDSVRNELTNLVHELRPQSVDEQDFAETIKEYTADWSHRSGIELNINIVGDDELSVEIREALFRITQEALANTARHSSAHCVDISLEYGADMVKMIIKDDGHGFDKSVQHSGVGLYSMRERAEVLGGNLAVESSPDQGTKIELTLPRVVL
jgi:NarL family two-component system sensor histidine kinase LiaS